MRPPAVGLCLVCILCASTGSAQPEEAAPAELPRTAADVDRLLRPARVTIDVKDRPLSEVVEAIIAQTGNVGIGLSEREKVKDRRVTFKATDLDYFKTLDKLCRQEKLIYHDAPFGAIDLSAAKTIRDIGAYAGPAVVKLESCERTTERESVLRFSARMRHEDGEVVEDEPVQVQLHYELVCYWEDRLWPMQLKCTITEVLNGRGMNLLVEEQTEKVGGWCWWASKWMANRDSRESLAVYIDCIPEYLSDTLTFKGEVEMRIPVGERRVSLENVFGGEPREDSAGGTTFTLTDARRGDAAEVTVRFRLDGKPRRLLSLPHHRYGFRLVDAKGRPRGILTGWEMDSSEADAGIPRWTRHPTETRLDWTFEDDEPVTGTLVLNFDGLGDDETPWSLVYVFPERIETRTFPFVIENVPVPKEKD